MSAGTMTCEECGAEFPANPANVIEVLRVKVEDMPTDPDARAKLVAFMLASLPIPDAAVDTLMQNGWLSLYGIYCSPSCAHEAVRVDRLETLAASNATEGGAA
jgi:hypothetical protein